MSKMPKSVTPSMPLKTAMPSDCRISAPAPWAINSGSTPRMNAIEVMMIGRSRSRQASSVASRIGLPVRRITLANSTIRIAFLLARPTSTTRPIWVKMLMSRLRRVHPDQGTRDAQRHRQDHRQRHRPALELGRQHQEDHHDREGEDDHRRVAGLELEVGQLGPFVAHRLGQLVAGQLRHQVDRLARADARRRRCR